MKLFYRAIGEKGPAMIILHGIFGTSDNWLGIGKAMAENHRVFLLDQRNHGQSPWDEAFDYQVMSEDLFEFIQDHALDSPILIGHSMGGKVVMQFDLNHPGLAKKSSSWILPPNIIPCIIRRFWRD